jgi:multiple sugar transport system permease protein
VNNKQIKIVKYIAIIFLAIFVAFIIFPIYWAFNTSFKEMGEVNSIPPTFLPKNPTLKAYVAILGNEKATRAILNSIIISVTSTALAVALGSLAGYAFARWPQRAGGENLSFWILSVRMFPPVAAVLPIFFIFNAVGLTDSYLGLIITYLIFNLPLSVWLMMMFFGDVPRELEEASYVDGYKPLKTFLKVTLPMVKPGLVSVTILCWIFAWNEFLFAYVLVGSRVRTFPLIFPALAVGSVNMWNQICALALIVIIPPIVLFIILRKYMVRGLSLGVVKG